MNGSVLESCHTPCPEIRIESSFIGERKHHNDGSDKFIHTYRYVKRQQATNCMTRSRSEPSQIETNRNPTESNRTVLESYRMYRGTH